MIKLFTSESVTPGHPDKLCDQISDNILDAYLSGDSNSRVACEVCAHKNGIVVMGEITSNTNVDIEKVVRDTIINIGYDNDELGFNGNNVNIEAEMMDEAKNGMKYQVVASLMSKSFASMNTIIKGQNQ